MAFRSEIRLESILVKTRDSVSHAARWPVNADTKD